MAIKFGVIIKYRYLEGRCRVLAWVFESIDKTFTNFKQITDEKKELITEQISVVNKLMKYNELFTEFQRVYKEYLNTADGTDTNKTKDLVIKKL